MSTSDVAKIVERLREHGERGTYPIELEQYHSQAIADELDRQRATIAALEKERDEAKKMFPEIWQLVESKIRRAALTASADKPETQSRG